MTTKTTICVEETVHRAVTIVVEKGAVPSRASVILERLRTVDAELRRLEGLRNARLLIAVGRKVAA